MRALLLTVSILLILVGAAGLLWWYATAPTLIASQSATLPEGFPDHGFSHAVFEQLLQEYTRDGRVNYASWHGDAAAQTRFDTYLAALAEFSPENAPERFADESDRKVYWVNAYNAFVIKAILEHWPIKGVKEIKAPIELIDGLGFFVTLEFVAGGKRYSLRELEKEKVTGSFADARLHFVLICGSGSCPVLQPKLPSGAGLDEFLDQAAAQFVASPDNVSVDHAAATVTLSAIFQWYEDEFLRDLHRSGVASENIVDYIAMIAADPLRAELAKAKDYRVIYDDYDWSLNDLRDPPGD